MMDRPNTIPARCSDKVEIAGKNLSIKVEVRLGLVCDKDMIAVDN